MNWEEISRGHKVTIRTDVFMDVLSFYWECECFEESNNFYASHQGATVSHTAHVKRAAKEARL